MKAHDLPDKQRVALGPLIYSGHLCLGRYGPRKDLNEVIYVVPAEFAQAESVSVTLATPLRYPCSTRVERQADDRDRVPRRAGRSALS